MLKRLLCSGIFVALIFNFVSAQDGLPANPDESKCYVKCVTPDEWGDSIVRVLKKPAYSTMKVVPAEYKTVTETIVIKEASKKYEYVPATYKTVDEVVVIEEGYNKLTIVPSKFSDATEVVETKPALGRWEMGEKMPDCESDNPADCRIVCWKEYPAETAVIPTEKKDKDDTADPTPVQAKTKVIKRQVIDKAAYTKETAIPEQTKEVTRKVLVKDETTEITQVDAVYEEVTKRVLIKKGGLTVWREVECEFTEGVSLKIFYASGSAALNAAAKTEIDTKLYGLMQNDPLIRVELSSHTDSRGDDASNKSLSQRRAQSVVDYLVSKGIRRDRMVPVGYGETRLTNRCRNGVDCSASEHQANRRTEFRVLSR